MNRAVDLVTSYTSTVLSLGLGFIAHVESREPDKPLELYEFEACPFCRKTREAFSEMDISPIVYPCPRGGTRYRPRVADMGGKKQFPFLVDPNTGAQMYESMEIVRYVSDTYAGGKRPAASYGGPITTMRSALVSLPRGRVAARASRAPEAPLTLYSFEASPYCRIAREALSRLEIPYRLVNVAKKSRNREAFIARSGRMMVPYLIDPNTNTEMFESAEIARYLAETYGA
jgi:glutathione S-transferase